MEITWEKRRNRHNASLNNLKQEEKLLAIHLISCLIEETGGEPQVIWDNVTASTGMEINSQDLNFITATGYRN